MMKFWVNFYLIISFNILQDSLAIGFFIYVKNPIKKVEYYFGLYLNNN